MAAEEEKTTQSQNSPTEVAPEPITPMPDRNVEAPLPEYLTEGFDPAKLPGKEPPRQ